MARSCVHALAAVLALTVSACKQQDPRVGAPTTGLATSAGIEISLANAVVGGGRVTVLLRATRDGAPMALAQLQELQPLYTLAALGAEPVTGVPAWRSLILTGQAVPSLPPGGPGTPAAKVLTDTRQPFFEALGTLAELAPGSFTYTYATPLPAATAPEGERVVPATTLRAGVFLHNTVGTARTSATIDFTPSGAAPAVREPVTDAKCAACHGVLRFHGNFMSGVKLCVTCHTWQHVDPDSTDPAAMAGATPATDPNPLELSRLVHRVHRGRNMPTLYRSSSSDPAPPLDGATAIAAPFFPGRNAPLVGQKYSIIGYLSTEWTFGRAVARSENGMPAKVMVEGIGFPRDYRSCDTCHAGAPDARAATDEISRRTCSGCHPDIWFGDGGTDAVHLAHRGGPQADDTQCAGCHLSGAGRTPVAPIAEAHVALRDSPHWDAPVVEIVGVENFGPGKRPTVLFRAKDRLGTITPLGAPVPASDPSSPVERALVGGYSRIAITIAGPAAEYRDPPPPVPSIIPPRTILPATEVLPATLAADAGGVFRYTFDAKLPDGASGTWGVAIEARRVGHASYDATARTIPWPAEWPYTGEAVTEFADNPIFYVDAAGGTPAPRREVVDRDGSCNACHGIVTGHGGLRHKIEYCVMCHTADGTDWARRPKDSAGNTNLGRVYSETDYGTYDGIEERSIHMKVMIHRIHTGGRKGPASLATVAPHVIYAYPGGSTTLFFFEDLFPGDIGDCRRCHLAGTYQLESVPAAALPTVANETPTVLHKGTLAHVPGETSTPPVTAACMGCHATEYAKLHVGRYIVKGTEQCTSCHGAKAAYGTGKVHGVAE